MLRRSRWEQSPEASKWSFGLAVVAVDVRPAEWIIFPQPTVGLEQCDLIYVPLREDDLTAYVLRDGWMSMASVVVMLILLLEADTR
jgi:hypothetical protein